MLPDLAIRMSQHIELSAVRTFMGDRSRVREDLGRPGSHSMDLDQK